MTTSFNYPGFGYPATELLKYITVLNDFTIILKDGDIIKHTPDDDDAFKRWLDRNHIQNMREEEGWVIDKNGLIINPLNDFSRIRDEKISPPFQNYFIEMKKEAFEEMVITLGPKCSFAEEIIVESLVQRFNPNARIVHNKYIGLIK